MEVCIGGKAAKAVHPKPNDLSAHDHTAFSQKVLNISGAQSKAMIRLRGVGNDLTSRTKTFQKRHINRNSHEGHLRQLKRADSLAMPFCDFTAENLGDAERAVRIILGQSSGILFDNSQMLAGDDTLIKPDRMA